MNLKMHLNDVMNEDKERGGEALSASRQNQDFPQTYTVDYSRDVCLSIAILPDQGGSSRAQQEWTVLNRINQRVEAGKLEVSHV